MAWDVAYAARCLAAGEARFVAEMAAPVEKGAGRTIGWSLDIARHPTGPGPTRLGTISDPGGDVMV